MDVPSTVEVILNPYHLPVQASDGQTYTDEVISMPQMIVNRSNVDVKVSARLSYATNASDISVVTSSNSLSKGKKFFPYVEFQNSNSSDGNDVTWTYKYTSATNQLLANNSTRTNILSLAAGSESPSYGVFRLFGRASVPETGMWTQADAIDLTMVLTIKPAPNLIPL